MKRCPHCGASNPNAALVCGDCGQDFAILTPPSAPPLHAKTSPLPDAALATVQSAPRAFLSRVDVMLVLPWWQDRDLWLGWMGSLVASGPLRIGVVRYGRSGDPLTCAETGGDVFSREGWIWEDCPPRGSPVHGGPSDGLVRSLDALTLALSQPYRAPIKAVLAVLDQPPLIPDQHTPSLDHVIQGLQRIQRLYVALPLRDPERDTSPCQVYVRLLEGTEGLAVNLGSPTCLDYLRKLLIRLAEDPE